MVYGREIILNIHSQRGKLEHIQPPRHHVGETLKILPELNVGFTQEHAALKNSFTSLTSVLYHSMVREVERALHVNQSHAIAVREMNIPFTDYFPQ